MSNYAPAIPVVAALLAGGASRRMGRPKEHEMLGGRTLASWSAAALAELSTHRIQVGGSAIAGVDWPRIPDRRENAGPAGGIETALGYAPGAAVVLCAVDTPFVTSSLLRAALDLVADGAIAAAPFHDDRWHPLAGACAPRLLPALREWLDSGKRDLQTLFETVGATPLQNVDLVGHGPPSKLLLNVNCDDDLRQAEALL